MILYNKWFITNTASRRFEFFTPFQRKGIDHRLILSLIGSSGEILSSRNLLLIMKSLFSSSKSPSLRIPFSCSVLKQNDFPSMRINLLFHIIGFETDSTV